jgi:hypothetical protein
MTLGFIGAISGIRKGPAKDRARSPTILFCPHSFNFFSKFNNINIKPGLGRPNAATLPSNFAGGNSFP